MSIFCLLWVPLFYLLRRSIVGDSNLSGSVWALLLGSITAIIQFFLGYLVSPGGFGFSRFLFGFIDLVSLAVIIPLFIYFLMMLFRGLSGGGDFANFALLWLIPVGALRALGWSAFNDPILLILVPVLWTALASGIPFFINWMLESYNILISIICVLCMLILPVSAAATYWAFFSQQTLFGFALLAVTNVPLVLSFVLRR
ncbi:MAG: hypothetical protein FWD40_00735 [Treponema sp.]|nr:hypothetical protein [Treponema sp.]